MPLTKIAGADLITNTDRRRSRRVAVTTPIDLTTAEPSMQFSGRCNSIDASLHGCQFFLTRPFKHATLLRLHLPGTQETIAAYVVRSMPALPDMNMKLWKICVEFARPGNYFGTDNPSP